MNLSLFLLLAFLGDVIGTTAGFGSATILTAIAIPWMEVKRAIALVAIYHAAGNASRIFWLRGHVHWKIAVPFAAWALLFTAGGALLTGTLQAVWVQILFGAFLLLYVLSSFFSFKLQLAATPKTIAWGGIFTGFVTGLIGTGGAIRAAFLLNFPLEKESFVATSALIALIIDLTRIAAYTGQHFTRSQDIPLCAGLALASFLGARVGKQVLQRLPVKRFRQFILGFLFLMAVKILWGGIQSL
ncbi:MAG: sulfite exporter TauE/SafE family protein [Elusimicrobia bacterium]|nr:sulfite exporter TauE/SafE family protein [Elusimicrobiota bacterium]